MPGTDPALFTAEEMLSLYATGRAVPGRGACRPSPNGSPASTRRFNAFAVLNPRAMEAAGESAARWAAGRPLGLLDGVPVTVKDLVDLAGFPTRRGSRTTDPTPVAEDAPSVRRA